MASATQSVIGDKEVIRALERLPENLAKKALIPSLRKAANEIVLPAARSNLQDQQEGGTGARAQTPVAEDAGA